MSNGDQLSIREIVEQARITRSGLALQESSLQDKIDDLDDLQWVRKLTKKEREQRKQLRTAQTNVRAAMVQLSFVTIRALDQSSEISRLINAFQSINLDLKKDIEDIEGAAEVALAIQNTMAQIAAIAANVARLVAPV